MGELAIQAREISRLGQTSGPGLLDPVWECRRSDVCPILAGKRTCHWGCESHAPTPTEIVARASRLEFLPSTEERESILLAYNRLVTEPLSSKVAEALNNWAVIDDESQALEQRDQRDKELGPLAPWLAFADYMIRDGRIFQRREESKAAAAAVIRGVRGAVNHLGRKLHVYGPVERDGLWIIELRAAGTTKARELEQAARSPLPAPTAPLERP